MDLKEVASLPKKVKEKFLRYLDKEKLIEAIVKLLRLTIEEEYILEDELFDFFFYDYDYYGDCGDILELYKKINLSSLLEWLLNYFKIDFKYEIQRINGDIWMIEYENSIELKYIIRWLEVNSLVYDVDSKSVNVYEMNEEQTIDVIFLKIRCNDEEKMDHLDGEKIAGTNDYIFFDVIDNSNGVIYNRDLETYEIPNAVISFMNGYDIGQIDKDPVKYSMFKNIKEEIVKKISQTKEMVF